MLQIKVDATQDRCWEIFSQPEYWHRWAPWLPVDVQKPRRGSRIQARFVGLPLPGKITVWQPCWRWDWRWGLLVWKHQVEALDDGQSMVSIEITGPGSGLVDAIYRPVMRIALQRLKRLAEEG